MSNTGNRGSRNFFGGTGAYIALFLVVTALAVAGYWTLIPRAAEKPAAELPASEASKASEAGVTSVAAEPEPRTEPEEPPTEPEEPADEPPEMPEAEIVQGAAEIVLPEPAEVIAPVAPALVVDPLRGETVAAFSMDALQYSETMGDWRTHDGVDIAAEAGTPVCAASSGTVLDVRDDDLMGTTVVISHDGGFDTVYANLQSMPTVEIGDYVTAGQVIGAVGRTALCESSEPTHLHFGVTKDGNFVDPEEYLKN